MMYKSLAIAVFISLISTLNLSAQDTTHTLLKFRKPESIGIYVAPEFQYEWISIPHIYNTPFYCYAYSFGQLLVLSLYRRYQQEGDAFKPGYMKLLAYGGSARPEEILQEVNIDITSKAFWQGGFDVIRGMIDELAAIGI